MELHTELRSIFEALGWEVQCDLQVEGETVPLYLKRKVGDPLATSDACVFYFDKPVDEYGWKRNASLQAMRRLFKKLATEDVSFYVIAPSYHPQVYDRLKKYAKAMSFAELLKSMINLSGYCRGIMDEFRTEVGRYYPQRLEHFEGTRSGARTDEFAMRWLGDPETPVCMVVAEAGMGKTTFTRYVCSELARRYVASADENWVVPVRIPLHEYRYGAGTFESLIQEHFRRSGYDPFPVGALIYYLGRGKAMLILDGFDEMLSASGDAASKHNMEIIAKGLPEGACVMLTCRSQYFRSPDEVRGYMGLFDQHGFEADIWRLGGFDDSSISSYCAERMDRSTLEGFLYRLSQDQALRQLAQNPFLLDSLVAVYSQGEALSVPPTRESLVQEFCDVLIKRDQGDKIRASWSAKFEGFFGLLAFLMSRAGRYCFGEETARKVVEDTYADEILSADDFDREYSNASRQILQSAMLKQSGRRDDATHEFLHPLIQQHMSARHIARLIDGSQAEAVWEAKLWPQELLGDLVQLLPQQMLSDLIQTLVREAVTSSPTFGSNVCRLLVEAQAKTALSPWKEEPRLFSGKNLAGLTLQGLDLRGCVFEMCILSRTQFIRCNLEGADFRKALYLDQTHFEDCSLRGADFSAIGRSIRSVQTPLGTLRRNDAIGWLLQMGANVEGTEVKPLPRDHGREIAWSIIRKFYNQRNIRKKRDSLVRHGFPSGLFEKADEVLSRLVQLGFIEELPKRSTHEPGYRLVPQEDMRRFYEDRTSVPEAIAAAWPV